ncbi:Nucleoredoxin [Musa troglodytarum]|uniref:protein-disulfide reductase n=1 Tax=Musa troglodytarum TaxID=320322 RepID=A0A9E7KA36_9LILI|nr:Nucleoredoxin [Musa troglodytarum]
MNTDPGAFEFFLRMPWLAVPVGDERIGSLENTLEVGYVNTMVVIGPTGQTITNNAATSLEREPMPTCFGGERIKEVEMAQTLESLLVAGDLDYVIGKEGLKVMNRAYSESTAGHRRWLIYRHSCFMCSVKELVGKTILLFFSARWSGTCRGFLPHPIEEYHKIKRMDKAFEVVNISMDKDRIPSRSSSPACLGAAAR